MKNQFVTYEIAKKLKELGFNEMCLAVYCRDISEDKTNPDLLFLDQTENEQRAFSNTQMASVCAPLWQQVIDWLRESHNKEIIIEAGPADLGYSFTIYYTKDGKKRVASVIGHDELVEVEWIYPQARKKAILKALELIEKK